MKPNFSDFPSLAPLRFQPTPGQVYADLAGELAILDSKSGIYYGLDAVGARIWGLLIEWRTLGEIRNILLDEYDVEPIQLEGDMAHLLDELLTKNLIELVPAGAKRPQKSERQTSERH
jgi:hypothetical protein